MEFSTRYLLLLTAPPASGKTYWVQSLISELNEDILFISPLRALADECKLKWGEEVSVMTPEEWLGKKVHKRIVIFDEFHLNYYWGDTFRPLMWEAFYELASSAELSILLTATVSEAMKTELELFQDNFDSMLWVDHGNQQLKNYPIKYFKFTKSADILSLIRLRKSSAETSLVFCAYREEVSRLGRELSLLGLKVWTCVGGEAGAFSQKVATESPPDFIISTTVLSHGVNLPNISRIYFLYEVENIDFWIQMVARGGRKGEVYSVYSLEQPHGMKWGRWTNAWAILPLRLTIWYDHTKRQFHQWFLKD